MSHDEAFKHPAVEMWLSGSKSVQQIAAVPERFALCVVTSS
jgi:hypothetical protein